MANGKKTWVSPPRSAIASKKRMSVPHAAELYPQRAPSFSKASSIFSLASDSASGGKRFARPGLSITCPEQATIPSSGNAFSIFWRIELSSNIAAI